MLQMDKKMRKQSKRNEKRTDVEKYQSKEVKNINKTIKEMTSQNKILP